MLLWDPLEFCSAMSLYSHHSSRQLQVPVCIKNFGMWLLSFFWQLKDVIMFTNWSRSYLYSPTIVISFLDSFFLPAGCREVANCRYCFYSQAKNQVFRPAGATRCTDSGQTLQDRRAPGSAWLCKMWPLSVQRGGNAAPKMWKISTFW